MSVSEERVRELEGALDELLCALRDARRRFEAGDYYGFDSNMLAATERAATRILARLASEHLLRENAVVEALRENKRLRDFLDGLRIDMEHEEEEGLLRWSEQSRLDDLRQALAASPALDPGA